MIVNIGFDCKSKGHLLQSKDLSDVYRWIQSKEDVALYEQTKQLRSVLKYSKERYREMKTRLPFFCCSMFDPANRSIQNFKRANGLILDYDFGESVPDELIRTLKMEPRIALGYVSPSNQGLKLVFKFTQPLEDACNYTNLYKSFSRSFSIEYDLMNQIDTKNCDVSRISFMCHDSNAWYNEFPVEIEPREWMDLQNEIIQNVDESEQEDGNSIDPQAYREILRILKSKPRISTPERKLEPIIEIKLPELTEMYFQYGIELLKTEAIQYGVKLKLQKGKDTGEINIYHGKRGFQVVVSPRRGTNDDLNAVSRLIAEEVLKYY